MLGLLCTFYLSFSMTLSLYMSLHLSLYLKSARGQCLTVRERESPSDLALLDFISAPPGPTKDTDLVGRKLSRPNEGLKIGESGLGSRVAFLFLQRCRVENFHLRPHPSDMGNGHSDKYKYSIKYKKT